MQGLVDLEVIVYKVQDAGASLLSLRMLSISAFLSPLVTAQLLSHDAGVEVVLTEDGDLFC